MAVFALGATLFIPALFGNTCSVATLDQYLSGSEAGCTLDGYTVDFTQFTAYSVNEAAELLGSADITVTPTFTTRDLSLEFSGAFSNSTPGSSEEYTFQYLLDPELPHISGATVNTGPNDPISLTGEFCGDGVIVSPTACSSGGSFLGLGVSGNDQIAGGVFPSPVTNLDTELTLVLGPSQSVQYFGSTAILTATPEPSTLWLTPGLLGLAWLRKKWLGKGR